MKKNTKMWSGICVALAALLVSGCSGNQNNDSASSPQAPASAGASQEQRTSTPDSQAEPVTLKLMIPTATGTTEAFYKKEMESFMQKYPNIHVDVMVSPANQYANSIQLSFSSNEAPDVFRLSGVPGTLLPVSYSHGWLSPITKYATDDFKNRYPEGTFSEASGLYIDGDLYAIPMENVRTALRYLYYNKDLLSKYGFSEPPQTWSELKKVAQTITDQSKGAAYGFSIIGKNPQLMIGSLQSVAGGAMSSGPVPINLTTGKSDLENESFVSSVNFVKDLIQSNILTPGWENWDGPSTFQQFASGKLAMYVGASFHIGEIQKLNPDLNFDVAPIPAPDSGRKGYFYVDQEDAYFGMSSSTEHPDAAWKLMDFLGSVEFQKEAFLSEGMMPAIPGALDGVELDYFTKKQLEMSESEVRRSPNPAVRNGDGSALMAAIKSNQPKPNAAELYTMALIGNKDFKPLAEEFDKKAEQVIEEQLKKLQDDGSTLQRSDITFDDWNPMENYSGE